MTRLLTGIVAVGLVTGSAIGGTTITPLEGTLGNPFNNGTVHGWGWNGVPGAADLIGNIYDNVLTINGGAAHPGFYGAFGVTATQAFMDWTNTQAQWGDDLHIVEIHPDAWITSLRYGYRNPVATATHTIQIYQMIPPSADHPLNANSQFGTQLMSLVLPGIPTGTAIVTVTGLSVHNAGTGIWIKFGESGPGFPGTFWLSGGVGGLFQGVGTSHNGIVYDLKNYYGPGAPLHQFYSLKYFYFPEIGGVFPNIQVALSGIFPAPAAISLLGLGGLMTLGRRRDRRMRSCTSRGR